MKTGELTYVEMGVKPILTQRFIKWLLSKGLEKQKTNSRNLSHTSYNYPLLHIHTNLQTMGISKSEFEKEIQKF
jgi:hypothetical protein